MNAYGRRRNGTETSTGPDRCDQYLERGHALGPLHPSRSCVYDQRPRGHRVVSACRTSGNYRDVESGRAHISHAKGRRCLFLCLPQHGAFGGHGVRNDHLAVALSEECHGIVCSLHLCCRVFQLQYATCCRGALRGVPCRQPFRRKGSRVDTVCSRNYHNLIARLLYF